MFDHEFTDVRPEGVFGTLGTKPEKYGGGRFSWYLKIREHPPIDRFELHLFVSYSFFQVGNKPVYGVAIPTVDGIRRVLDLIGASKYGSQRVLWHNLREEPVCNLMLKTTYFFD